ncbi:MAG: alpha/beta hydrolase [Microcoleaceae cyanobacterium]
MIPIRKSLKLPNIKLSYLEWNGKNNRTNNNQASTKLLLLHGLADHALVWGSLAESLSPDYHIIAPDLRGHGNSTKPNHGYTFEDIIKDLEAFLDSLQWSKIHILGHSWSGKLLPIWANKYPERFKSMILVDPIFINRMPSIFKLTLPIVYQRLDCLKGMGPFDGFAAAELNARQLGQYSGWSELQQAVFEGGIEQKSNGMWGSKFTIAARNQIFAAVMETPGFTQVINIPSLFIKPEKGVNRMNLQLKPYQAYLKHLNIQNVPGNHWPFLVEPTSFNTVVRQFLAQIKQ